MIVVKNSNTFLKHDPIKAECFGGMGGGHFPEISSLMLDLFTSVSQWMPDLTPPDRSKLADATGKKHQL